LVTAAAIAAAVVVHDRRGAEQAAAAPHWPQVHRAPAADARSKPNIVFIYSDDQNAAELTPRFMPNTVRLLAGGGTRFTNFVVAAPICCPSRAGMMTGTYPHQNGVYMNHDGFGSLKAKANTIGSWMQRAGYRTAWLGKFLQGYGGVVPDPTQPAPGFDDWLVSLHARYFGWKLYSNFEGVLRGGDKPRDYYTEVLTNHAVRLFRERAKRKRPLFMVVNQLAPHKGKGGQGRCESAAVPAPRDYGRFGHLALPRPPSFNEADRSDKTAFPAPRPLGAPAIRADRDRYRCRAESLAALDRGVRRIYTAVRRAGELDNTVFVYTSDNGLLLGEHALDGKDIPYEEGIRMPLLMRVPGRLLAGPAVGEVDQLTANVDLAPTLLELAGARPCVRPGDCRTLDGRSLVPLLGGGASAWPADRAIPIEGGVEGDVCGFRGLRLATEVLLADVVPDGAGGCVRRFTPEYYDLEADPYQLDNLLVARPTAQVQARAAELEARMGALQRCAGIAGRDPRPRSGQYCD
jgi:N-acetylglucosamine-6-sulfatase